MLTDMSEILTTEKDLKGMIEEIVSRVVVVPSQYVLRNAFTITEVAGMFGKGRTWVDNQIKAGRLETIKPRKRVKAEGKRDTNNEAVTYITRRSIEKFPN